MAMSALAHRPAAFAIRMANQRDASHTATDTLTLRPTGDGWALLGSGGDVVFRALGLGGRRQCLEFARAHGVVAVLS